MNNQGDVFIFISIEFFKLELKFWSVISISISFFIFDRKTKKQRYRELETRNTSSKFKLLKCKDILAVNPRIIVIIYWPISLMQTKPKQLF